MFLPRIFKIKFEKIRVKFVLLIDKIFVKVGYIVNYFSVLYLCTKCVSMSNIFIELFKLAMPPVEKKVRGEVLKKVKKYRKDNPFVPKDYTALKMEYKYQSKVDLIPGSLYKVVCDTYVERVRHSVYRVQDFSEGVLGCFKYVEKDLDNDYPYVFKGLGGEIHLSEGDLFCIGVANESDLEDFNHRMNIFNGINSRLKEIRKEQIKLTKYLDHVREEYYKTFE